jgi:hypothetical protein
VYSDNGAGGFVGVSKGGGAATNLVIGENVGTAPEGTKLMHADYTLANATGNDAFALWFVEEQNMSRYMRFYNNGYLHFWVRSDRDLQVSIRSNNITAGSELSKFRLSELGIPTDGNWQEAVISLAAFKDKESRLDFDQVKTYFAIGAISAQIGEPSNRSFDVDDVRWLTADAAVPDANKVFAGLLEKQRPSGLVRSYDMLPQAVTYDQALTAMAFIFRKNISAAEKLLDVYNVKFNAGGFGGFHDEYDVDSLAVRDDDRLVGPNAWMLLAIIHYRNVTGSTRYDGMMDGLAAWIRTFQAADGGMKMGTPGASGIPPGEKGTEFNFDCYAAFRAYSLVRNNPTFATAASNVFTWLRTTAWNAGEGRFNAGVYSAGGNNTDKALDAYSWAPLATSSFTSVVALAKPVFGNKRNCNLTGVDVDGFDFGDNFGVNPPVPDAVWLEGTAQMVLAYLSAGDTVNAAYYLQELEKAIVVTSPSAQCIPYATNPGDGYGGFTMDSLHPAISASAWYLFAKAGFNPFQIFPMQSVQILTMGSNAPAGNITWTANIPTAWVRANQYLKISVQPISSDPWGVQIYTDNTVPAATPHFVDPTPDVTNNPDSNPAGLLSAPAGATTTSVVMPMAWSIKDTLAAPGAEEPNRCAGEALGCDRIYFKDHASPALDLDSDSTDEIPAFSNGESDVTVLKAAGLHSAQGPAGFFPGLAPDYVFLQANFTAAAAQLNYVSTVALEFFNE